MLSLAQTIRNDGFTILQGALQSADVDATLKRCTSEFNKNRLWFAGGTIVGHITYTLPPNLDIIAKLITNTSVVNCASEILGSDYWVLAVAYNVNLSGSTFQPPHADGGMVRKYLTVNLPLGDVNEENGNLEVFAGTDEKLTYAEFLRACHNNISRRANTSSGDVIIRYPGMWHRGTPNHSGAPRFMITVLLGTQSSSYKPIPLSPENMKAIRRTGVHADMIVTDTRAGTFHPTYFQRTPPGMTKEILWRYAPAVYNLLRRA